MYALETEGSLDLTFQCLLANEALGVFGYLVALGKHWAL